jgi:membrane protease YdiL (CAAX protease family)
MDNIPAVLDTPPRRKLSFERPFWAFPITRIVLYALVAVVFAVVSSLILREALKLTHHHKGQNIYLLGFFGEGLGAASAILAFWVMVRFVDRRPWETAGFGARGLGGLLGGFVLGAAMLTVGVGVMRLLGLYHVSGVTPSVLVLAPLLLFLCVGVFEETFFRGYIFQTLEDRWGSGVALGVTSLVFGLTHLLNPAHGASGFARLAGPLFICLEAGLPLGAAYLLTRCWWLPIGIHWAWDYFEGPVYGCPDSGTHDPHTLLQAHFSGPAWLTGGPFGPESGIVFLTVGTVTGLILLRAAIKKGEWRPLPGRHGAVAIASA